MKWPWVSRGQYETVLSAKEEVIQVLRDQMVALEHRLAAPISVSVTLPEGFAVQMPAVVRRRKPQDTDTPRPVAPEVDWASIDENDNVAMARAAANELGALVPPAVLSQTVSRMKMTIRAAKRQKLERALKEGRVGTQSSPAAILTEDDAMAQRSAYVPEDIRKLIESAEKG